MNTMTERLPIVCTSALPNTNYHEVLHQMGIKIVKPQIDDLFMEVTLPKDWHIRREGTYWSYVLDEKGRERASFFAKLAFWDQDAFLNFSKRFSISSEIADYDVELFKQKPKMIQDGFEVVEVDVSPEQMVMQSNGRIQLKGISWDECLLSHGQIKRMVTRPKLIPNSDYVALSGYEKYSQPFHYEVFDHDKSVLFKSQTVQTDVDYTKETHWDFFHHREQLEQQAKQECLDWLEAHYPDWLNPLSYWN